jgi:hypothetical protein
MSRIRWVVVPFIVASVGVAHAEAYEDDGELPIAARAPANGDSITPGLTHAASAGQGIVTATGNYSEPLARKRTTMDLNGEIQLLGPLRLVLRVDDIGGHKAQPGIGAAVQFLSQAHFGVDASAYFSYKSEGFTETEGELEGLVSFGRQMGAVHGTLNLAYGQDADGNERDGEAALALHVEPLRGLFTGVIGRYRDALGSNGDQGTHIVRDALGAVSATYVVGRYGVTGSAGIEGITLTGASMQGGMEAAIAVGAVF